MAPFPGKSDQGPLFAVEAQPGVFLTAFAIGPHGIQWLAEQGGNAAVTIVVDLNTQGMPKLAVAFNPVNVRDNSEFMKQHVEKLFEKAGKKKKRIVKP